MESTNDKIIALIRKRMDIGNVKFGRFIPIPFKNATKEALEELLDGVIYLACYLIELIEREEKNGKK